MRDAAFLHFLYEDAQFTAVLAAQTDDTEAQAPAVPLLQLDRFDLTPRRVGAELHRLCQGSSGRGLCLAFVC